MPVWQGLELLRDPYSASQKGEVVITGLMLVGDVIVLRERLLRSGFFPAGVSHAGASLLISGTGGVE